MNMVKAVKAWGELEQELKARTFDYIENPRAKWVDPFKIFGDLYYIGDKVVSSYLVDSGDGLILFDTGFPHTADLLFERIKMLGFSLDALAYVIHSHEHFDHFGATRKLQQLTHCKTCIHKAGAETFRFFPHHTELQSAFHPGASLFVPDLELNDGDILKIGELSITCIHTPGHSAGAATYFFDLSENGVKKTVGFCGINGTLPLHAGRLHLYGIPLETRAQYCESIDLLREYQVDITIDTHPRPGGIIDTYERTKQDPSGPGFADAAFWGKTLDDYDSRMKLFLAEEQEKFGD